MRGKLIKYLFATICLAIMAACQSNKSIDQEIERKNQTIIGKQLNTNLETIITNKKVQISSNPNDYIKANQEQYDEIIKTGNDGLEYLVKGLKQSKDNGLKEWIMAKACEDILKEKKQIITGWSTGKEWLNKYEQINR